MRVHHVVVYGALDAALGVACGGRTTDRSSPAEPVHEEGGISESSARAPTDAGSSDADAGFEVPVGRPPPDMGRPFVDVDGRYLVKPVPQTFMLLGGVGAGF